MQVTAADLPPVPSLCLRQWSLSFARLAARPALHAAAHSVGADMPAEISYLQACLQVLPLFRK